MDSPHSLHGFPGGLSLDPRKDQSTAQPLVRLPLGFEYVLPLLQHEGDPAEPVVAVGERVLRGQVIARAEGYLSLPIHAPTSGTVTAILPRPIPHPSGLLADCIVIEADGMDEPAPEREPIRDPASVHPSRLRNRLRECGVAGLGGAAFPAHVKLNPTGGRKAEVLIINGAQCEPYISCDDMLLRERSEEVVAGVQLMLTALDCPQALVAIESDTPEAMAAVDAAIDNAGDERIRRVAVPTVYPEGGERQLIQTLLGREVPSGGLPIDVGAICHNVATALAAWRAVFHGEALTERVVTVSGEGVAQPRNVIARLGTPVSELIAFCGGYTDRVSRLIMGGPMMGFALASDEVPVVKGSTCILAASDDEVVGEKDAMPCIRCGECAEVCPAGLLPQQIYWHARDRDLEEAANHHLFDCIECGCCDVVCPSHIPLVQYFRAAKTETWAREQERRKSDLARRRYEERQARLAREAEAKRRRLEEKKAALAEKKKGDESVKSEIDAIMSRVKARKRRDGEQKDN
ncbi:electron transport complex subunit RsxC [Natronospira bacteriovora]|uniref:Ion-translocating oxidoreductase complex subunit C n=1 Tax=Natronospira bacteriovora TaxID=3069753 RepID=A0ABU0W610_9GAMM|nr:electron transport complex subunit RsxC [Natronospira sp. AB-CW4]MDQ2069457.1 electron transport complex subunit RsxC [Natronospira sp. AB-CW4]